MIKESFDNFQNWISKTKNLKYNFGAINYFNWKYHQLKVVDVFELNNFDIKFVLIELERVMNFIALYFFFETGHIITNYTNYV
jgi:hypothetical protein